MYLRYIAENATIFFILAGVFLVGCIAENPVITGTSIPQITSLPDGKVFVRSQNIWIANKKFSNLSLVMSWQKWLGYKKSEGNTYVYYTSNGSWTGYSAFFQILVIHDSIAKVIKTETRTDGDTGRIDTISIRDVPSEQLSDYMSVDNMYKYAQDSIMSKSSSSNEFVFQLFENGLVKKCKYYPKGCVDDCWFGISIDSLFFGEIRDK